MKQPETITTEEIAALAILANGIIPADARDGGAAAVSAGPHLADKLAAGVNASLYRRGLVAAETHAQQQFGRAVAALEPPQVHALLAALREKDPTFFRQLRADVSALYLSDPAVWRRIGFPGPSTAQGGYPDFDQPQGNVPANLFSGLPLHLPEEVFTTLLNTPTVRVERIVSQGHASPEDFWYDQEWHEWILLLKGAARLLFEDQEQSVEMRPGDWLNIPAHRRHRLEWTAADEPTVWLAVHYTR